MDLEFILQILQVLVGPLAHWRQQTSRSEGALSQREENFADQNFYEQKIRTFCCSTV